MSHRPGGKLIQSLHQGSLSGMADFSADSRYPRGNVRIHEDSVIRSYLQSEGSSLDVDAFREMLSEIGDKKREKLVAVPGVNAAWLGTWLDSFPSVSAPGWSLGWVAVVNRYYAVSLRMVEGKGLPPLGGEGAGSGATSHVWLRWGTSRSTPHFGAFGDIAERAYRAVRNEL